MKELPKNNPFKTPKSYLENFTDRLIDRLSEEKLDLPKENGFEVPKDYFENLNERLQKKLNVQETKVIQLHSYKRYYITAASIVAGLLLFFGLYWKTSDNEENYENIALISIEEYILNQEDAFISFDITDELLVTEDLYNDLESIETQEIEFFLEKEIDNLNFEDYEID